MNRYITHDLSRFLLQTFELSLPITLKIDQLTEEIYHICNLDTEFLEIFKVKKYLHTKLFQIIQHILFHTDPSDFILTKKDKEMNYRVEDIFLYNCEDLYPKILTIAERFCYYQKGAYKTWHTENDRWDLIDQIQKPIYEILYNFYQNHLQRYHISYNENT